MAGNQTKFQIDVGVQAGGLTGAAASLDALSAKLQLSGSAAEKAAEDLRKGEASFRSMEGAANGSAKALERINVQLAEKQKAQSAAADSGDVRAYRRSTDALNSLIEKQASASLKAQEAARALDDEGTKLGQLREHAKVAANSLAKISDENVKAVTAAKKAADELSKTEKKKAEDAAKASDLASRGNGKLNEAAEAFGKLGGPVGSLGQKAIGSAVGVEKLFGSLGAGNAMAALAATGVGLVVAAVIALGVAVIGGAIGIATWATKLGDARRSTDLLSQGITQSVAGGKELEDAIYKLGGTVPQSSDELRAMAGDLAKTGLKGQALTDTLAETARKAAAVKWGPDWARQTAELGKVTERFEASLKRVFGGLKLDALLSGLSKVVGLLDENTESGKTLKYLFESIFQPLIDGAAAMAPKVVSAFIQLEIFIFKALIAIHPFKSAIILAAEALGVLAAVMLVVGVVTSAFIWLPFVLVAGAIAGVIFVVQKVMNAFAELKTFLSGMSLLDIGTAMVDGLVRGITGAAGKVTSALGNVVQGGIDSAKSLLQINSPSRVFAEIGASTTEGMVDGIDAGASGVQGAMAEMVAPPADVTNSSSSSVTGAKVDLSNSTWYINGEGADDLKAKIEGLFTSMLEGKVAQLGGLAKA
jgi:hypothetical protein